MTYFLSPGHHIKEQSRLKELSDFIQPFTETVLARCGLHAGKHCLDFGCGNGDGSVTLGRFVKQAGSVTCVDADQETTNLCMRNLQNNYETKYYTLPACDLVNTDYIDKTFDFVFCRNVVMHQPNPMCFLQKLYEKVSPNGILCVIESNIQMYSKPHNHVIQRYIDLIHDLWYKEGLDPKICDKLPSYFAQIFKTNQVYTLNTSLSHPGNYLTGIIAWYQSVLPTLIAKGLSSKQDYEQWYNDLKYSPHVNEITMDKVSAIWAVKTE